MADTYAEGVKMHFVPNGFIEIVDVVNETVKLLYGSSFIAPIKVFEVTEGEETTLELWQDGKKLGERGNGQEWEDVSNTVLAALQVGDLSGLIENQGQRYTVPMSYWQVGIAELTLLSGVIAEVEEFGEQAGKPVFVEKKQVDEWLRQISAQVESAPYAPDASVYSTAYMNYMGKAAAALGLSDKNKLPIDNIKEWLRENWPQELGKQSMRDIDKMATFLRPPDAKKGGFFNANKNKE